MRKHPIQHTERIGQPPVLRFKANAVVARLLNVAYAQGVNLNTMASWSCDREDFEQFAQLIGYSVHGFCDLYYVSEDTKRTVLAMADNPTVDPAQAEAAALREMLDTLREQLREPIADLYNIHPDDLKKGKLDHE